MEKQLIAETSTNSNFQYVMVTGSLKLLICSDIFNVDTLRSHANNLLVLKDQALLGAPRALVVTIPLMHRRRSSQTSSRRL